MIKWVSVQSTFYWQTTLAKAFIGNDNLEPSVSQIIFDSGSSLNHIPSPEFKILIDSIRKHHKCRAFMKPLETWYCQCRGVDDPSFPSIHIYTNTVEFRLHSKYYLLEEEVQDPVTKEPYQCMLTMQEDETEGLYFWLMGDSFLRAFYSIYDVEGQSIGFVGDVVSNAVDLSAVDQIQVVMVNPYIYILPTVLVTLCCCFIIACLFLKSRRKALPLKDQMKRADQKVNALRRQKYASKSGSTDSSLSNLQKSTLTQDRINQNDMTGINMTRPESNLSDLVMMRSSPIIEMHSS